MSTDAQKTPISLLQELCAQQGLTPDYKLMSVEGAVHAPTFMYRVQIGDAVATATGQSKKKAKHAAAKAILEQLLSEGGKFNQGFVSNGVTIDADSLDNIATVPSQAAPPEDILDGNPVGSLQELCMKQRWQPPFYETEKEVGLPHAREFYIACYVHHLVEIGMGKSKRLAKRQAADNMLTRLKNLQNLKDDEKMDEVKLNGTSETGNGSISDSQSHSQSGHGQKVLKFLKDLKTSNYFSVLQLQEIDFTDSHLKCVDLLDEIAVDMEFEVKYLNIESSEKPGYFHCLVQIYSLPIAVCFGSGVSKEDAKADAAFNALQFIKVMSKK